MLVILNIYSILANMIIGFVVTNRIRSNENTFEVIDEINKTIFAMFFALTGVYFNLGVIK